MPIDSTTFRVASYGNSDPSDISTPNAVCQQGSIPSTTSDQCYNRLDIQIAYANIGSVDNPQPILGAVIFHYQRITLTNTTTLSAPLLLTRTVTFQDISNVPVTQGDHLPQPNTRLPGDFFYAFFRNHASTSSSLSLIVYLLINLFLMFILM
ncbi:hypothetical protein I4U23_001170 [Adineta vaga]|nr:hypothetical protein I4U23_001170 [Adineta vaga]